MAALLASPSQPLQGLLTFSAPLFKPSSLRRFPTWSSTPLCSSRAALHVSASEWPFEQRMREALHVLDLMQAQGMDPDRALFCTLLQSCADEQNLEVGRAVHARISECGSGMEEDAFVGNNLINMYAKCGDLLSARELFDGMPVKNAVSWTTVISMYSQFGRPHEALRLYGSMKLASDVEPNAFTYATVLNSCAKTGNLKMGIEIHEDLVRNGLEEDGFVVTALIDMYAKCGKIDEARKLFDRMLDPNVAACTAMLEGYNMNNRGKDAMDVVRGVLHSSVDATIAKRLGFPTLIKSCVIEGAVKQGQEIHGQIIKQGCNPGARTLSSLVLLYEKSDKIAFARRVFDDLIVKDNSLFHKMVCGYIRNGLHEEGLEFFTKMLCEGFYPNSSALSVILDACADLLAIEEGKQIHGRVIKGSVGLSEASAVSNLVRLYYECGELDDAQKLMRWQSETTFKEAAYT